GADREQIAEGEKGEADQLEVGCREPNRDGEECEEHIVQAARPTPAVSAVSCQLLMVDELEGECCVARVVDGLAATHGSQDSAPAVAVDSFPPVVIPGAVAGPTLALPRPPEDDRNDQQREGECHDHPIGSRESLLKPALADI